MLKQRTDIDDSTLLCEKCGYVIEGLPVSGNCPECGQPIAESLPAKRAGSWWQQSGDSAAWVLTGLRFLTRPRASMRGISIAYFSCRRLLWWNLCAAAMVLVVPGCLGYVVRKFWASDFGADVLGVLFASALLGCFVFAGAALTMRGLVRVEELGIRAWGTARGGRINRAVAMAVCSHASFGWVVGCAAMGGIAFAAFCNLLPPLIAVIGLGAAGLGGMLLFECLVYVGVRACRYANPPGAGERASAES